MKRRTKKILKICVFILIANLPFLSATQIIGMDIFLDSFESPEKYVYFEADEQYIEGIKNNDDYYVLQKTSHPEFTLIKGDTILYSTVNNIVVCNKICSISCIGALKKYHVTSIDGSLIDYPIYDYQIIGKVVSIVDNNIWNVISMKIWEVSIHNLNVHALFTNQ